MAKRSRFAIRPVLLTVLVGGALGLAGLYAVGLRQRSPSPIATAASAPPEPESPPLVARSGVPSPANPEAPLGSQSAAPQPPVDRVGGGLDLQSSPSGARVFVDEYDVGRTPAALREIVVGPHRIRIAMDGYITQELPVVFSSAQPVPSVMVTLTPLKPPTAAARAAQAPPAQVPPPQAPAPQMPLPQSPPPHAPAPQMPPPQSPPQHAPAPQVPSPQAPPTQPPPPQPPPSQTPALRPAPTAPRTQAAPARAETRASTPKQNTKPLTPPPADPPPPPEAPARPGLAVESHPAGAWVFFDNKMIGITPLHLPDVPDGKHTVRLELRGYRPWSEDVQIVANQPRRVRGALEKSR
jgi:hypothetical protein